MQLRMLFRSSDCKSGCLWFSGILLRDCMLISNSWEWVSLVTWSIEFIKHSITQHAYYVL
jgi:hypothetical protein